MYQLILDCKMDCLRRPRNLHTYIHTYIRVICIAPLGRDFRGAGARQRVSEQRKEIKACENRNVFSLDLKTVTESVADPGICGSGGRLPHY